MAVAERATKVVKDSNKMDQSVGQGKAKRDAAIAQVCVLLFEFAM